MGDDDLKDDLKDLKESFEDFVPDSDDDDDDFGEGYEVKIVKTIEQLEKPDDLGHVLVVLRRTFEDVTKTPDFTKKQRKRLKAGKEVGVNLTTYILEGPGLYHPAVVELLSTGLYRIERVRVPDIDSSKVVEKWLVDDRLVEASAVLTEIYKASRQKPSPKLQKVFTSCLEQKVACFRQPVFTGLSDGEPEYDSVENGLAFQSVDGSVRGILYTMLAYSVASAFRFELYDAGHRIFPYLVVVGPKGLGKSTLGKVVARSFGEVPLDGFNLESPFRFARLTEKTTLPIVIEESKGFGLKPELLGVLKDASTEKAAIAYRGTANQALNAYRSHRGVILLTNEFQVGDAALLDRCHVLKLDKVALKDFPNLDFRGLYQAIALKIATEMEEKEIPKDLEARYLLLKDCVQRWALSMRNMYGGHGRGFDLDCFWRFGEAALDLVGLPYKVLPSDVSDAEVKEECDLKARLMSEVGKIKGALSDLYAGSDLPHYGIYASTRAGVKGLFLTPNAVSSLTGMSFRKAASRGLGEITSTVKANVRMTGLRVSMLGHWDFPLETPENFEITEKDLKDVEVEVGRVPLPAKEESEAWKVDDDVTEYYRQRGKRW